MNLDYLKLTRIIQDKAGMWIKNGVAFYDGLTTDPPPGRGMRFIPFIRDIPHVQLQQINYPPETIKQYRDKYVPKFSRINRFVTMTDTLAQHIKSEYGIKTGYSLFRNYPNWRETPVTKRKEIVYIDNSGSKLISADTQLVFLNEIARRGTPTAFVCKKFPKEAQKIADSLGLMGVKVTPLSEYDYGSEYGIQLNTHGFNQAHECLNRKLLMYLMSGMKPLMHETFLEGIKYIRSEGIHPFVYTDFEDLDGIDFHDFGVIDRKKFCMETRIPELYNSLVE